MNFIDISAYQRGLNLDTLFEQNPLDGVIVKATGGVSHVQTTCDPWVQRLLQLNKPWGFYHFLDDDGRDSSGEQEAEFFVRHCENYFGDGLPFADYEARATDFGTGYLKEFLDTVYELTGIRCGVYCNLSTLQRQDFTRIAEDYPLWLAQYADNARESLNSTPWQKGSIEPYERFIIHQYSANGRLKGYDGALDLDRVYISREEWERLAAGLKEKPALSEMERVEELLEEALKLLKGGKE